MWLGKWPLLDILAHFKSPQDAFSFRCDEETEGEIRKLYDSALWIRTVVCNCTVLSCFSASLNANTIRASFTSSAQKVMKFGVPQHIFLASIYIKIQGIDAVKKEH